MTNILRSFNNLDNNFINSYKKKTVFGIALRDLLMILKTYLLYLNILKVMKEKIGSKIKKNYLLN